MLNSCSNCCFNGLQYQEIGLAHGYCQRRRCVLYAADETTCGWLMRKDLSLSSAVALQQRMMEARGTDEVQWTTPPGQPAQEATDSDISRLEADTVGRILIEDGVFGSAITTLAQLRRWTSARTEGIGGTNAIKPPAIPSGSSPLTRARGR